MTRVLGALLVALSAGGVGAASARAIQQTGRQLCALRSMLSRMSAQLRFAQLPLAELFSRSAEAGDSALRDVWQTVARALEDDPSCTAAQAFDAAGWPDTLPREARQALQTLAASLGQTDLEGQLSALALACERLEALQADFEQDAGAQIRCRWALGLGAAAALVIVLI